MFLHRLGRVRAPEFPKKLEWLNSEALTMKRLLGKAVLLDFWTLSSANCLRTLPSIVRWHQLYADHGLVVIGVHTPEFAFEGDRDVVAAALLRQGIEYPVVLDTEYAIWNLYGNRWWPRVFLIDPKGSIVYDRVGEGGYAEIEQSIQKVLMPLGHDHFPAIPSDESLGGSICYRMTPEVYFGFLRGSFGNADRMVPNKEAVYSDATERVEGVPYLHGHWEVFGEGVRHARALSVANEYVVIKYSAFVVNVVARPTVVGKKGAVQFIVELDGQSLPEDMAGEDIVYKKGAATVVVQEARLYNIVDSSVYHHGTLKLKTAASGLELFAVTFEGCRR